MKESVRTAFVPFSAPLEGVVNYMYADIKGLITTAIGVLIDPVDHALRLPWRDADGTLASAADIVNEFRRVKSDPKAASYGHRYAKQLCRLHLDNDGVAVAVEGKLNSFDKYLSSRFPDWESWPADAQLATLSMAWACGPAFRFPALDQALRDGDFELASQQCHINESGNPGIIPRNKLNKMLYQNAARSASWRIDPEDLVWPNWLGDEPPTRPELPSSVEEYEWEPKVYVEDSEES